jgi:hypothetical protein
LEREGVDADEKVKPHEEKRTSGRKKIMVAHDEA